MSTPGRLTVRQSNISTAALLYLDDGEYVAKVENGAEIAARLSASWNATLSVPLDVLERIDVGRLVEAAEMFRAIEDQPPQNRNATLLIGLELLRDAFGENDR